MFTLGHFIWLIIIVSLIVISMILIKKLNVKQKTVETIVLVLLVIFKIIHFALSMKQLPDGSMVLYQTQLSFHLCSIQIYLIILTKIVKNEKFVNTIKSFMVPCMVIGASFSLLIPTEGVDPTILRVWQYMLIHGTLVFYGFYLMLIEKVDLSLNTFYKNLGLLVVIVLIGMFMNSVLEQYGTNFLYLRMPPMEGLPILNLNHGWYIYFVSLSLVAIVLIFLVQLPFIIKSLKKNKS